MIFKRFIFIFIFIFKQLTQGGNQTPHLEPCMWLFYVVILS